LAAAGSLQRQVVTFEVTGEMAAPINQVVEILPYRPQPSVFDPTRPLLGVMMDRGRSIPLFCLPTLAGLQRPVASRDTCVLVVQSREEWLGFVVPRLWAIDGLVSAPGVDTSQAFQRDPMARALATQQSVVVAGARGERILRLLDLHALARRLQADAQADAQTDMQTIEDVAVV
jgi:purine-binding chemotaxis protein CheW